MEAVAYLRFSSHAQREVSIDQQYNVIKEYAARQGIDIVGRYEDRALTGTNDKRPGFQKMIADAASASWQYIIVYSLDRFARDRYDSAIYKRKLREHGVKVLSAMENISDDPTGVLVESVLEGLAEYYSKELSQKIKRGMADNASKCLVNGLTPYGYNRSPDGKYVVNEAEAAVIREIYERVSKGEPFVDISADLNSRCIRTSRGGSWNRSSYQRILTNKAYIGIYCCMGQEIEGGVPAIIDQDIFDAVQLRVANKKNPRNSPQRRRRDSGTYILTGKIYCGECREPMTGVSGTGKNGTPHFYYQCKGKRAGTGCHKKNVKRDAVESAVARSLRDIIMDDDTINVLVDAALSYQQKQSGADELVTLQRQLQETETAIRNILKAVESGLFYSGINERLAELDQQKRILSARIEDLKHQQSTLFTADQIKAALLLFREGNIADKRFQEALIDAFLHSVYVYDDHYKVIFTLADGSIQETELPEDLDESDLSDVCLGSAGVHHIKLYEPMMLFVYEIPAC